MPGKSITYRDLRNTPGQVFERLRGGEPIPLVSEGETRALLIPVEDGDAETALEAWRRGRAFVALSRLQQSARDAGSAAMSLDEIDAEVKAMRAARHKRELPG